MSQQRAEAIIATAEPTTEFFALATTYGLGWALLDRVQGSNIPVYAYEGTEDALRAFLAREDTWAMDEEGLQEYVKVVREPVTEFHFEAAASVMLTTDPEGHVTAVDVNVLDGVDPPRDEDGDLEPDLETYDAVYDRAEALGWKIPAWTFPPGFDFGGAF